MDLQITGMYNLIKITKKYKKWTDQTAIVHIMHHVNNLCASK